MSEKNTKTAQEIEIEKLLNQENEMEDKLAEIVDKSKTEIEVVQFEPQRKPMTFQDKMKILDNTTKMFSRGLNMLDKILRIKKQLTK